jgi:hypothetical protein
MINGVGEYCLPPFMGFSNEGYVEAGWCVPFYTCLVGPLRVFVYFPGSNVSKGWAVECIVDNPARPPENQFFGTHEDPTLVKADINCTDPVTLMSIIQHITQEGPIDGTVPSTSPTDTLSTLLEKAGMFSIRQRE